MDLQYVFVVVVATVFAAGFHACGADDLGRNAANTKVYCGRQLSDMLSTVCKGNYNTLTKKSDIYHIKNSSKREVRYTPDPLSFEEHPYRSKMEASTFITFRRRRRGVYNECCKKACTHEELLSYCGDANN